MKKVISLFVFSLFASSTVIGQGLQFRSKYPDIPIVDVHSHASSIGSAENLIKVREIIKERHGSNLAFWISLNSNANIEEMKVATNNRMLFASNRAEVEFAVRPIPDNAEEYVGINLYAEEVIQKVRNDGYVGVKIWFGALGIGSGRGQANTAKLDDPRLAQFFSRLEEENIMLASLHIADVNGPFDNRQTEPYLRIMVNEPVWFWQEIRALENVLAKYPNLTIVAAHAAFLFAQDAQIDYLRYLLSTYPNLYVDISATDFHLHYSSRDNHALMFAFLETDQILNLGYFRNVPFKGLALPREVLEKIYYKNALKLYPGLKKLMGL
jgi:hypothetical protein